MTFRILFQDDDLILVDKPAGFHVHPPEDQRFTIPKSQNCLSLLRDQVGRYLYPIHRLDRATSGVLAYAFSSDMAGLMGKKLQNAEVMKRYICIVRGWVMKPLDIDNENGHTLIEPLYRCEVPHAIGRYPRARLTLLAAIPITGKYHQIRKHLSSISHPIIGDRQHGDRDYNRYFSDQLGIDGMLLKAHRLSFTHPKTGQTITARSRWEHHWHLAFNLIQSCAI